MGKINYFTILIAFLVLVSGCGISKNFPTSNSLKFESRNEKIPLRIGVYISDETKKKEYIGTESAFGQTTELHSPIGMSMESNSVSVLNGIFKEVVLSKSKYPDSSNVDLVVEIEIIGTKHKYWLEGPTSCRTSTVHLRGKFYDINRTDIIQLDSYGEIDCRKWQCQVNDKSEGLDQGVATIKSIVNPLLLENDFADLYALATNSALQMALENLIEKILSNKGAFVK